MKTLSFLTLTALLSISACSHHKKSCCADKAKSTSAGMCSKEACNKPCCDKEKKCSDDSCSKDAKADCADGKCDKKKT